MSTKDETPSPLLASVDAAEEADYNVKMVCTEEQRLMRSVGSIPHEFGNVPNVPVWLTIARFMEDKERQRIFPNIPELKGVERLAEAQVASLHTREYIQRVVGRDVQKRLLYFVEEKNRASLFPDGLESFLTHVRDLADKPNPNLKLPPHLDDPEWYRLYNQKYVFPKVIKDAFRGKESLISTREPVAMLDVSQEESELWFNWGANMCGFVSKGKFEEFCALAGIDPRQRIHCIEFTFEGHLRERNAWVSHDRKVTFTTMDDPRRSGGCHYFGCTGIRSRSKFLFEWFKENGEYAEYCWNGRDFI